jgi:hypothetical protein
MNKVILVAHGEGGQGTFSIPKVKTITPGKTDLTFVKAKEYMDSSHTWPEYASTSFGEFDALDDTDCLALFGKVIQGTGIVSTGKRRGGDFGGPLIYAVRGNNITQSDITNFIQTNAVTSMVLLACRG